MKKYILTFLVLFLVNVQHVSANIICNDGSVSPTCSDCHQGCCSWHGGCSSGGSSGGGGSDSIDWGPILTIGGGAAAAGAIINSKGKKK